MSKNYNRKRINSLKGLDREQANIKRRTKQIEEEWLQLLDPQQLVINLATSFITNKLTGKKKKEESKPLSFSKEDGKTFFTKKGPSKKTLKSVAKKVTGAIVIGLLIRQGLKLFQNKQNG